MDRKKNATRNILWGVVSRFIALGLPFITRTTLIYTMGMKYVGLGSLFTSILQVLSFAELGIGGALVFSMYNPMAENNDEKICSLLNFYKKAYRIIGIIVLVLGIGMMLFLDKLIASDLPENVNIYLLFMIYLVNNVLGYFLFAYKQSLFIASQRIDVVSKVGMILQLLLNLFQILMLVLTHNYYLYVIGIPLITCLNNLIINNLSNKYFPKYICRGEIDDEELTTIKLKVRGLVYQKIGSIVLTSVDTVVISAFLGLIVLAKYQNYYYIITAIFGFLTIVMQSIVPVIGNSIATESVKKNYDDFVKFNFIYIWIVSWCAICLLCLYQPFMKMWVGQKNTFNNYIIYLFVAYFFVHKWCDMLYVYQEACGIWWETRFVPLIAAVTNLSLNLLLVQSIGLYGILLSTIIAVVFIYDIGYAKVLFKTYFSLKTMDYYRYWLKQFFYLFVFLLAAISTFVCCKKITVASDIVQILVNSLLCLMIPNIIFVLCWRGLKEYKAALAFVKDIIRKRRYK